MKKIIIVLISLIIVGSSGLQAQEVGSAAPDFEVTLEGGGTYKLSDQLGKVVFVFLFGNLCPYCIVVGPDIESSIYKIFKENEYFSAIGLDTWDNSSNDASVSGFRTSSGISFPLAIKAGWVAGEYATTYDRLMVIDTEGVLVHKGKVLATNDISNAVEAINESLMVASGTNSLADSPTVRVYPNPAVNSLFVDSENETVLRIDLYDVTGKRIEKLPYAAPAYSSKIELQLDHLKSGLYFYSIQMEENTISGKFIIQR